jgi:hypothetical protein
MQIYHPVTKYNLRDVLADSIITANTVEHNLQL